MFLFCITEVQKQVHAHTHTHIIQREGLRITSSAWKPSSRTASALGERLFAVVSPLRKAPAAPALANTACLQLPCSILPSCWENAGGRTLWGGKCKLQRNLQELVGLSCWAVLWGILELLARSWAVPVYSQQPLSISPFQEVLFTFSRGQLGSPSGHHFN